MGLISNGTTIFDAGALDSGVSIGSLTFIKKLTASSSSTLSFVNGSSNVVLDSTYKEYIFTFKNIHPNESNKYFGFNMSVDSGSNYNVTKTTAFYRSIKSENDTLAAVGYRTGQDLAQATGLATLMYSMDNDNDSNGNGFLHLFNPSSTTFVKHFISNCGGTGNDGGSNRYAIPMHLLYYSFKMFYKSCR